MWSEVVFGGFIVTSCKEDLVLLSVSNLTWLQVNSVKQFEFYAKAQEQTCRNHGLVIQNLLNFKGSFGCRLQNTWPSTTYNKQNSLLVYLPHIFAKIHQNTGITFSMLFQVSPWVLSNEHCQMLLQAKKVFHHLQH